ncbi:hypothetical protein [Pyxidicoccus xibeiensis]|uniref:hypothetical protein n=1 Tax=Pyxidicoccus xibeiensis TaxID=2906759 RepID=UPI0020A78EE5|nr:hypothetical protein [Pyxidicoccus xibeiensis]MCP3144293.1 hypothetical protein [Pyxidicoccus xibeiensis]
MSSPSLPRFPGVPDLLIERYLCGELPPHEAQRVEEAARASPSLASHLEHRRAEQRAFADARAFAWVGARIEARRSGVSGRATGLLGHARSVFGRGAGLRWALPALGLCSLLVIVAVRQPATTGEGDTVRVRGGLTARVLVKRGETVFEHAPGVVLRPGDRVRVEVEDAEGGTLYVVGLSDHGRATPLHGFDQTGGAVQMEPGRLVLPGSLELDAAPEREALVMVLAEKTEDAPSPEDVLRWAREATHGTGFPPRPEPLPGTRYSLRELPKEQPW